MGDLTVSTSLQRFTELLEAGFSVAHVDSTDSVVVVRLTNEDRRVTLRLGPDALLEILDTPGLEASRASLA